MKWLSKRAKAVRKNKEVGVIGALTVVAQLLLSHKSDKNIDAEFAKIHKEFKEMRIERERTYARKEDVSRDLDKIKDLQFRLNADVVYVSRQVADLKSIVKKQNRFYSLAPREPICNGQTPTSYAFSSFALNPFSGKQIQRSKMRLPGSNL